MIGQMRRLVESGVTTVEEAEQMISGSLTPKRMEMWPTPRAGNPGSRPNGKGGKILAEEVKKSLMWPTPRACDTEGGPTMDAQFDGKSWFRTNKEGVRWGIKLKDAVAVAQTWPTPTGTKRSGINPNTGKGAGLSHSVGGQLNPTWVEWLMGWPIGWTDLKPLATDKYQQWQQQHSEF